MTNVGIEISDNSDGLIFGSFTIKPSISAFLLASADLSAKRLAILYPISIGIIVLPLEKPCNIRRFRLSNPQTVCTFPCFFPYGLKQGKDFYSPLTTLSSSRAELRFASLVEWA